MSQFRIVVTEIKEAFQPNEQNNATVESEIFRQVINDLNLPKFVRQVNSSPRRSRKATKGVSVS